MCLAKICKTSPINDKHMSTCHAPPLFGRRFPFGVPCGLPAFRGLHLEHLNQGNQVAGNRGNQGRGFFLEILTQFDPPDMAPMGISPTSPLHQLLPREAQRSTREGGRCPGGHHPQEAQGGRHLRGGRHRLHLHAPWARIDSQSADSKERIPRLICLLVLASGKTKDPFCMRNTRGGHWLTGF